VIGEQELRRLRRQEEEQAMAKRPAPSAPQSVTLNRSEMEQAVKRFQKVIERLRSFDPSSINDRGDTRIEGLEHAVRTGIEKTYSPGTVQYERLVGAMHLDTASINMIEPTPIEEVREGLVAGRDRAIVMLEEEVGALTEDLEAMPAAAGGSTEPRARAASREIFVVHGHDEGARETVAGFLRKLDLSPIILHEHANEGRTIIEKFEDKSSDAGFAVVLLTPDDVGGTDATKLQPRARQNVILELGYFVAKLGRKRVCALKKGDIEVPTDYIGVGYVNLDLKGGWRLELAREIKAAGIDVDLNKAV
jgi:predicted nucleotide-binding protein